MHIEYGPIFSTCHDEMRRYGLRLRKILKEFLQHDPPWSGLGISIPQKWLVFLLFFTSQKSFFFKGACNFFSGIEYRRLWIKLEHVFLGFYVYRVCPSPEFFSLSYISYFLLKWNLWLFFCPKTAILGYFWWKKVSNYTLYLLTRNDSKSLFFANFRPTIMS